MLYPATPRKTLQSSKACCERGMGNWVKSCNCSGGFNKPKRRSRWERNAQRGRLLAWEHTAARHRKDVWCIVLHQPRVVEGMGMGMGLSQLIQPTWCVSVRTDKTTSSNSPWWLAYTREGERPAKEGRAAPRPAQLTNSKRAEKSLPEHWTVLNTDGRL